MANKGSLLKDAKMLWRFQRELAIWMNDDDWFYNLYGPEEVQLETGPEYDWSLHSQE